MTYKHINFRINPQKAQSSFRKIPAPDFPVEKGAYLLGNEYSPVAVLIPMPNHYLAEIAIEAGAAIAGHLVTANIGIEKIVANIISNPNIRYLIICGKESKGHLAAQSLISLFANGTDEKGRILGSLGLTPYLKNLPKKAIDQFREQIIDLIDLLEIDDQEVIKKVIRGCMQEPENAVELNVGNRNYLLYDPGAYPKDAMIIRIHQKLLECGVYETLSPYSTVIHVKTIPSGYILLIDAILSSGKEVRDERGSITKELLNVQITISDPEMNPIPRDYRPESWIENDEMTKEYLEKYAETYFKPNTVVNFDGDRCNLVSRFNSAILDDENLSYTYGTRLREYQFHGEIIDQLQVITHAIQKAIEKGQSSRRFILSLVNPFIDLNEETEMLEIPCFTQFWLYNRFDGINWRLYGTMFLRSHDAQNAFPANCFAGMKILSHLCKETGCEMGNLTMFFGSAHIYVY